MVKHYLDIETTGLDFEHDEIITIQMAVINETKDDFYSSFELKVNTGSEKDLIKYFWDKMAYYHKQMGIFGCVFVGYNLMFDLTFLWHKAKKYNIPTYIDNLEKFIFMTPYIDLRQVVILMNHAQFRGTALSNYSTKKDNGNVIPEYYKSKDWDKIRAYILDEFKGFIEFYKYLYYKLGNLNEKYKKEVLGQ